MLTKDLEQTAALATVMPSIFATSATTKAGDASAFPLPVQKFVRCSLKRRAKPGEVTSHRILGYLVVLFPFESYLRGAKTARCDFITGSIMYLMLG